MTSLKILATLVSIAAAVSTLTAETPCPGNAASVPLRMVNRYQTIVAVTINHAGPYNFLLDTGTQMTMLEPALAATLQLSTGGAAEVAGVGVNASAVIAHLNLLEVGTRSTLNQRVLVYDLKNLQAAGLDIQGVLGEDFLEQFDMLIDNAHRTLCLDAAGTMQAAVKGQRVALLEPGLRGGALAHSLIVSAKLTDGMRPVLLKLDSGANASLLYSTGNYLALGLLHGAVLRGRGANGSSRAFTALPVQDVKIGPVDIGKVAFVTSVGAQKDARTSNFDGLLAVGLFKRVYIDHADHFAVLESR